MIEIFRRKNITTEIHFLPGVTDCMVIDGDDTGGTTL